jgi:hypothetical protein
MRTRTIPVQEDTVYCVLESQVAGEEEGEDEDQNYQDHSGKGGNSRLPRHVMDAHLG